MASHGKKTKSDLPLVPESVLRQRHDLDDLARKRAAAAPPPRRRRHNNKKAAFYVKKPETFLSRAKSRLHHERRYQRVLKKGMQKRASHQPVWATTEPEEDDDHDDDTNDAAATDTTTRTYQANSVGARLVFVMRIRDSVGAPRSVRRVLSQLRLRRIHEAVLVRYDDDDDANPAKPMSMRKLLHLVEPWVVYGPPSPAVVQDLLTRRGFGKVDGQRVPLSDNVMIEQALGAEHNIVCVEDLVHELTASDSHGDSFAAAAAFLWPFQLNDAKTRFERQVLKLTDGKHYGDLGEAINEYIKAVL